jgi:hypothetical protein
MGETEEIFEKSVKALREGKIDKFVFPYSKIRNKQIDSDFEKDFTFFLSPLSNNLIVVRNIGVSVSVYTIIEGVEKWCFLSFNSLLSFKEEGDKKEIIERKVEGLKKQYPNIIFKIIEEIDTVSVKKKLQTT